MLNLSSHPENQKNQRHLEKIDLEMPWGQIEQKLPRHISCLESKNHRKASNPEPTSQMPAVCSINLDAHRTEAINLAVNILKYQLNNRSSKQKHLENVRRNLKHRLEVAKAKKNRELVSILQEEFRQLETSI